VNPAGKIVSSYAALELPWQNNQRMVSSIPEGEYPIVLEYSPKFKTNLWELYGVENRSEAKIHVANFTKELNGCIGIGTDHKDINGDGIIDLINSKKALDKLHKDLIDVSSTTIKIISYV